MSLNRKTVEDCLRVEEEPESFRIVKPNKLFIRVLSIR